MDIVYVCRSFSGELEAVDGESAELKFVPINEVENYPLNPPVRKPLLDFINKMKGAY